MSNQESPIAVPLESARLSSADLLERLECRICCDDLTLNNYISYRLGPELLWCLVTTICSECLSEYIDSQNKKVKRFVDDLTSLNECSKLLKHLLRGEYGVPVNLHDPIIFPSIGDEAIPNHVDPEFGRKSEVYQLSIGTATEVRDPRLPDGPQDREGVRRILAEVVQRVSEKLRDYDETGSGLEVDPDGGDQAVITEIKENLLSLKKRLNLITIDH
jgi:hypothetical protein